MTLTAKIEAKCALCQRLPARQPLAEKRNGSGERAQFCRCG
jgi:hypothetical protein